jgi:hypothetical protein
MTKRLAWPALMMILMLVQPQIARSQDLANLGKQKPLDLSGSLALRLNTFSTTAPGSTRDPFYWTISGNPTLSVYGITLPFSFVVSDKQRDFRQPFNMFGVSPYYKKIRFHAGYRSVYFSDYTLSDHVFLGGGVEAEPSIFRLGFVYGRFMKAIEAVTDTIATPYSSPSFARKGFAAKFGMGTYNNFVDLILLKISDDTTSVGEGTVRTGLPGAENLVIGAKTHQRIAKIFSVDADFGLSGYTPDLRSPSLDIAEIKAFSSLYDPREASEFRLAGKASLGMQLKKFSLRLNYRRVEPDYQSMGAYYLNTDVENLTLAPSWSMLKSKLRFSGSIGVQRNNLLSDRANNSLKKANSLSVAFTPSSKWGINLNYSNYNMSQTRNYGLVRDTLQLEQFSNNINGNLFFNFGTKVKRKSLNFGVNYMDLADNSSMAEISSATTSLNPAASYRFSNTEKKFSFNINANASLFNTEINETLRVGGSAGLSKAIAKDKLKLGLNGSFYSTLVDGAGYSSTAAAGGSLIFQPHKAHSFNLGINFVNRSFNDASREGSFDVLGYFGYTFNF